MEKFEFYCLGALALFVVGLLALLVSGSYICYQKTGVMSCKSIIVDGKDVEIKI